MLGPESGFYVNSLTSTHITYKGQLTPDQVSRYFLDLTDPEFTSHLALVHSRFSTNKVNRDRAVCIRRIQNSFDGRTR